MVHTFTSLGAHIAVDVNSGAVHVLDKTAYDLLCLLSGPMGETCPDEVAAQLPQYDRAAVDGAWAELYALQREGLCGALRGESGEAPDTFFLRLPASAIVVGALTYFFRLALDAWEQAGGQGCCARRSAQVNLRASLLVLAAALLRLYDLVCLQRSGDTEEE